VSTATAWIRRIKLGNASERLALLGVWAATVIAFSIAKPDTFPTTDNFFINIFGTQAVQVVVAVLNVDNGMPVGWAILIAIAIGAFIGFVNGGLIVLLGIDSFIATLGTSTFIAGVVLWVSDSRTVGGISSSLVDAVILTRPLGIPLAFWYALGLAIIMWYVLEYTPLGRRLLFCGRGRSVARLSGLRVGRLRWGAMVASGVIAALAGVMYAGTTGSADPASGLNFLLPAFSAAFLGATTIQPGRFNPFGALVAVYFLATGITGLQQLGVDTFVQQLFYGGALVLAVALSQLTRKRQSMEFASME
jgi:ribose transport system permease protein